MSDRSVSITGATGFLGWHLGEAFQAAGWRVKGIVRPGSKKPLPPGVVRVEAALSSHAELTTALSGSLVVVHGAALTRAPDVRAFDAVNVAGTREVVQALDQVGGKLIFISSQAAAGPGTVLAPTREVDPPRPLTAYGRSKLAAEVVVRDARGPWTIVRPSAVYGPRDRGFLPLFRLASKGRFLLATPPAAEYTLVHVEDVVRAIVLAADIESAAGQTLFIGHPEPCSEGRLLDALAQAFARRYAPIRLPPMLLRTAGAAGDLMWKAGVQPLIDSARVAEFQAPGFVCAVDRATKVLGFTASVPLQEGVRLTAAWYRHERWV